MTTIDDKVKDALTQGWELVQELNTAEEEAHEARAAYNQAVADHNAAPLEAEKQEAISKATSAANTAYEKAVEAAQAKLNQAAQVFEAAKETAAEKRNLVVADAEAEWNEKIDAANHQFELDSASLQADSHTKRQKAQSAREAFERYAEQVSEQLGIDLKALLRK